LWFLITVLKPPLRNWQSRPVPMLGQAKLFGNIFIISIRYLYSQNKSLSVQNIIKVNFVVIKRLYDKIKIITLNDDEIVIEQNKFE